MRILTKTLALACLLSLGLHAQNQTASVSGFVTDATTGETLLLANVVVGGTTLGAATNNSGYYTLTNLQPGTYSLVASYITYTTRQIEVTLAAGQSLRLDIELIPDSAELEEVVVTAEKDFREEAKAIGVGSLETELIKQLPAVLEPDVFRSLQLLPGVKAASDYSSGLYIRGGGPDQTLILLDRTAVYNPSHFFGLFSTFNPDAIKDVRLYKGGYPAEYGGRLGSVVDIYNKDGNRRNAAGSVSLGILASRAMVEGPLPGSKGSWMFAARRSTLDPLLASLNSNGIENIPKKFYFYDFNGKINLDASDNDRFSIAFYAGADRVDFPVTEDANLNLKYGNNTISGNWTHIFSPRLFSNFTLTASDYFSDPIFEFAGTNFSRENGVRDYSAKGDFEFIPNEKHNVKVGFWAGNLDFSIRDTFDGQPGFVNEIRSNYASLYAQESFKPTPQVKIDIGLRSAYFQKGDFLRLEPRLSAEYKPNERVRLQAGYGRYYQFLTLITGALAGFDIWLTTDEGVAPSKGDQFVAGVKTVLNETTNLDVEGYYRTMDRLFELDPFLPDAAGLDYKDLFHFGSGYAYGVEVLLERTEGRVNGFLGYTFGVTRRKFPNLNNGNFYSPKYDRTHDLSIVANYDLNPTWRLTSVFTYGTGQAYTKPLGRYVLPEDPFGQEETFIQSVSLFNNARLKPYHRLDMGISKIGRFFGFASYEFQFQVINVYNRKNIWFIINSNAEDGTTEQTEVPQIPIPIPNLSFTLKF